MVLGIRAEGGQAYALAYAQRIKRGFDQRRNKTIKQGDAIDVESVDRQEAFLRDEPIKRKSVDARRGSCRGDHIGEPSGGRRISRTAGSVVQYRIPRGYVSLNRFLHRSAKFFQRP